MTGPQVVDTLVLELVAQARRLGLVWTLQLGTMDTAGTVTVDGDTVSIPVVNLVGAPAGSRVSVVAVPPAGSYIVAVVDRPMWANEETIGGFFTAGDTTTVTTFANLNGTSSVQITKAHPDTRLLVEVHATFFSSSTGAGVQFGVLVAGTDYIVAPYHQTLPGLGRLNASGVLPIPNVAAGPRVVQARWRRQGGAGTITRNADDWLSLTVAEVA